MRIQEDTSRLTRMNRRSKETQPGRRTDGIKWEVMCAFTAAADRQTNRQTDRRALLHLLSTIRRVLDRHRQTDSETE